MKDRYIWNRYSATERVAWLAGVEVVVDEGLVGLGVELLQHELEAPQGHVVPRGHRGGGGGGDAGGCGDRDPGSGAAEAWGGHPGGDPRKVNCRHDKSVACKRGQEGGTRSNKPSSPGDHQITIWGIFLDRKVRGVKVVGKGRIVLLVGRLCDP